MMQEKQKIIASKSTEIEEMDQMIHEKNMQIEKLDIKINGLARTATV